MRDYDVLIVGGGMAGASLGAEISHSARTLIVEMEDWPGYHATGRSVAFWEETYGGPAVQPLTTASGSFLSNPVPSFHNSSFLSPRRTLHIGRRRDEPKRDALLEKFAGKVDLQKVDPASYCAGLRRDWTLGILEPSCQDIDVAALHAAYLRRFRLNGGEIHLNSRLLAARCDGAGWVVETNQGIFRCQTIVNAGGAWADEIAVLCGVNPIGISPLRRTVVQLRVCDVDVSQCPLVMDLGGGFYFKPDGDQRIWLTPHDEEPSPPCDAAPEEVAIARAIARFQNAVDWPIEAVEHRWAGLRSFTPDRAPAYGYDPKVPTFFWFAGQGGFGIQTAPAAALLARSALLKEPPNAMIASIDFSQYDPGRFH